MDVLDAIFTRQSVGKVRPDPVPRELIEKILDAAVQAPNHRKLRPWRFIVLTGEARNRMGDVMAEAYKANHPEATQSVIDGERARPLRAPVLIAVASDDSNDPKVPEIENQWAVAAAVQNMLLAAHALGLGAMWRSGWAAFDPQVKAFFGLPPERPIIGFIYIGYPIKEPDAVQRPDHTDRTVWME